MVEREVVLTTKEVRDPAEWQAILSQFAQAHPLQSWAWGAFKSRWGWSQRALLFCHNNQPAAAVMLLKRQLPRLPFAMLYAPKGPLIKEEMAHLYPAVLHRLEQITRQDGALLLKIDPDVVQAEGEEATPVTEGVAWRETLQNRGWLFSGEQVQFKNSVTLDLTRPEEEILASLKQKTRYNIRLAQKKEVVVRVGTPADFPAVYQLYAQTAERDNFLIRPEAYYLDGWQTLYEAGLAVPLLAEYQNQLLGAVILVYCHQKAIYMYGASSDLERPRMPNYLLQWEAIRYAQQAGCTLYDFWGAPDEFVESDSMWGVWRFKQGFNGRVVHHIGAWDFPARPGWYKLYTQFLPRYIQFLKKLRGK